MLEMGLSFGESSMGHYRDLFPLVIVKLSLKTKVGHTQKDKPIWTEAKLLFLYQQPKLDIVVLSENPYERLIG